MTPQRTVGLGYQTTNIREDYTGYQRDEESGLEFAEARYYNPLHGRFTSVDPLNESGNTADPQTFNRYAYAVNDPLNVVDPSGMIPCSAEYSYGQCGGDDEFWGGGQFGDHVAYDRQTLGDVDPETQEFISCYLEQISNSQARYFIITYEKKPEEDDVVATFLIFYDAYEESNPQAANPRFYEDSVTVYQFLPRFWQGLNIMLDISAAMVDNFTFGQYSRLQNAYSRWMYGTRVINTQSDVFQDTDTSVTVFGIALPGPGGKAKGGKFLFDSWYKSTFPNRMQSIIYHLWMHGGGRSASQYTNDAIQFYNKNKHRGVRVTLRDGTPDIRIRLGKGQPGGYFTQSGQIVSIWYK